MMKKFLPIVIAIASCFLFSQQAEGQNKFGYVSSQELILAMPESKLADSALREYEAALNDQYEEMVKDYRMRDSLLNSRDTLKYTKAQLELKRSELGQLFLKVQGWQQEAGRLYQAREQQQMAPIYEKARKAIADIAKENAYTYVFVKEQLLASPPGDDLLPLIKKKLNIK
jgi:outer membrane protein